jgi:hypothetical protein
MELEDRLIALINKEVEPEEVGEEVLVYAFDMALTGASLRDTALSLPDEFNNQDITHLTMLLAGYAEGQDTLLDRANISGNNVTNNKH